MTERDSRPALHHSVFARLIAIMLVMAASLLAMVAGFYFVIVIPGIHASIDQLVGTHARAIAESRPDLAAAHRFAEKLDMEMRYEGGDGGWTTDESVPTLTDLEQLRRRGHLSHALSFLRPPPYTYYVAEASTGHYIFARKLSKRLTQAHTRLLILLLLIMVGVFVTAYLVLKHALRPLRLLDAGVTRLSHGQLDVVVPKQSGDEFGALTDAFNRMVRRVRDMVQARDQLLLDVSHELRSPLTRMKVALEMLPDGERKQTMTADVGEMETMVTELLELHRMGDDASLRIEQHDLVALVCEVTERYRDRQPGVRVSAAPAALRLGVDADRVRTVLRNLIENALKFSLPDSRAVEVTVKQRGNEAVVCVTDDGSGIPEAEVERLFEPFYRPDPSRSKRTGGFGLGLSICKRIMEAHDGTIGVERHDGRGVTMVLTFPLAS
jgi:signal transduction histidine kinase